MIIFFFLDRKRAWKRENIAAASLDCFLFSRTNCKRRIRKADNIKTVLACSLTRIVNHPCLFVIAISKQEHSANCCGPLEDMSAFKLCIESRK